MAFFRDVTKDAVRFWEWRRLTYNIVLVCISLLTFVVASSRSEHWYRGPALSAFIQAALWANMAYCTAYAFEFLFQASRWRESWRRSRYLVFIAGLLLGSILAAVTACVIAFGPLDSH